MEGYPEFLTLILEEPCASVTELDVHLAVLEDELEMWIGVGEFDPDSGIVAVYLDPS